jgi:hypothetical protein
LRGPDVALQVLNEYVPYYDFTVLGEFLKVFYRETKSKYGILRETYMEVAEMNKEYLCHDPEHGSKIF